jgi:GntR family transcriptional regulator/MocR family aminotransferase
MGERVGAAPGSEGILASLSVALDRGTGEPLVRQLYRRLRELILSRRLAAGARLPSTRKLSRDLGVSRTVTLEAFGQLAAEGFLETRQGAGHYVADLPLAAPNRGIPGAGPIAVAPGPSIWSARGRPFDPAWQVVDLFPSQVWTRMLGRGWRRHQDAALERHWGGLPALREVLAAHLHVLRGVPLTPGQVMITSGNADVLTLIARAVREDVEDPKAWVEDPGLGTVRELLANAGIEPVPVAVDAEGLRVSDGETRAPNAAMALVTPTRQFPLGMPLSLPRRLALLEWSRRSGAIVVDDDYDGEIRFAGRPMQSLASLDPAARVLTLGSFSKLTFPGLRLGYATGPPELIERLIKCRRDMHLLVPTGAQAALAEFIATGAFARHLRALRVALTRRRAVLIDCLRSEASDLLEVLPQQVGMHLTVTLSADVARSASDLQLAEQARDAALVLLPLSPQYAARRGSDGFLLGYAGWDEQEILEAVTRLVALLRHAAAR